MPVNPVLQQFIDNWQAGKFLCAGLDPDLKRFPSTLTSADDVRGQLVKFILGIVDAVHPYVMAFKPNWAFYLAHGADGFLALQEIIAYIHTNYPHIPVILDAKIADIDSTNFGYLAAIDKLKPDAVTIHVYLGGQALKPFLMREDLFYFALCRTSNEGAGEFQDLPVGDGLLYQTVARNVVNEWNGLGNCGLVVGATFPDELRIVREIVGDAMPILMPGLGAQGGDLVASVMAGRRRIIANVSRSILNAANPAVEAKEINTQIAQLQNMEAN